MKSCGFLPTRNPFIIKSSSTCHRAHNIHHQPLPRCYSNLPLLISRLDRPSRRFFLRFLLHLLSLSFPPISTSYLALPRHHPPIFLSISYLSCLSPCRHQPRLRRPYSSSSPSDHTRLFNLFTYPPPYPLSIVLIHPQPNKQIMMTALLAPTAIWTMESRTQR